jgi:hypothetical protein
MDNTTLITIASIGLKISIALFIIGLVLTVLVFWKLDIRNVYLIRSGRAKRKTVSKMQEHNSRTGKLREEFDLDYTTGKLKKEGRKSGRTAPKEAEVPFVRAEHSGNTGSFSDSKNVEMPSAQKEAVRESEKKAETAETNVLTPTADTVQLDGCQPDNYAAWINDAYDDTEEGGQVTETLYEVRVPIDIISKELIIHTNEIIEI